MSLYDTISIHPSLLSATIDVEGLELPVPCDHWQTKDLHSALDHYRLNADGLLEVASYETVDAPVGGWPDARGGMRAFRDMPHFHQTGWQASDCTADIEAWTSLAQGSDPRPHPRFPEARRSWHLLLRMRVVGGRLEGRPACVVEGGLWREPDDEGYWRNLIEDPDERARRAADERWRRRRAQLRRVPPDQALRRLLARSLPRRALPSALRALDRSMSTMASRGVWRRTRRLRKHRPGM